jgi:hypothetical protein
MICVFFYDFRIIHLTNLLFEVILAFLAMPMISHNKHGVSYFNALTRAVPMELLD